MSKAIIQLIVRWLFCALSLIAFCYALWSSRQADNLRFQTLNTWSRAADPSANRTQEFSYKGSVVFGTAAEVADVKERIRRLERPVRAFFIGAPAFYGFLRMIGLLPASFRRQTRGR